MAVDEALWVDGDKYMWDGATYAAHEEAGAKAATYESDGFETQIVASESSFLIYTRRVVTEIVLDGGAPP